jgi:hypothetical protein
MTTAQLIGQEAMILEVLQEVEASRSDDYVLYAEILDRFYPEVANASFRDALLHRHVPSYESIARVRRKVQRKYPEYESDRARKKREKLEQEYRAYAEV